MATITVHRQTERIEVKDEDGGVAFALELRTDDGSLERMLAETQAAYRERRRAFDELFLHRPYDEAGSGAYRWACILKRLDACDPHAVADALKKAIQSQS